MKESLPVLIVGGGPTGLTLGCHLLRAGIPVRVIERATERRTESKALGVHARTLEVFRDLGIADAATAAGCKTRWLTLLMGGRPLVRLPYKDLETPFPYMLVIPQHATERILEERFVALGGILERGVTLLSLGDRGDRVTATLEHDGDREEEASFAWIVGCDGAKSAVRDAIGVSFDGAQYDESFVLADVTLGMKLPPEEATAYASRHGVVVILPLPNGKTRILGPAGHRLPPGPPGPLPLETFERIVRELDVIGDAPVSDPDWVARFNVHRRIASSYRRGRVLLAGDAAHIHSPAGGQGMNVGIQDATNLAWKLALVMRGRARPELLDTYEAERRPVGLATINGTDSATKLATLKNPLAIVLRDLLVPFVMQRILGGRALLAASQLGTSYGPSGIARSFDAPSALRAVWLFVLTLVLRLFGSADRRLTAGERAPDAGGMHARFDGRRSTLLVFTGDEPGEAPLAAIDAALRGSEVRAIVVARKAWSAAPGVQDLVVDARGRAHRAYGASGGRLVLVRPDGYIGLTARLGDVDALSTYFRAFAPGALPASEADEPAAATRAAA